MNINYEFSYSLNILEAIKNIIDFLKDFDEKGLGYYTIPLDAKTKIIISPCANEIYTTCPFCYIKGVNEVSLIYSFMNELTCDCLDKIIDPEQQSTYEQCNNAQNINIICKKYSNACNIINCNPYVQAFDFESNLNKW